MGDQLKTVMSSFDPGWIQNLIYTTERGWSLFDQYEITKVDGGYLLQRYSDGTTHNFVKLRHAAAWAILDKYNKIIEAKRLLELDKSLSSVAAELLVHRRLQNIGDLVGREINRDKYLVGCDKQKRFQQELDKYIIMAKKCQDRGYQNELTRTARK